MPAPHAMAADAEGGLAMRLGRRSGQAWTRHGRWHRRVLRGLRPDRNPVRRTSDRLEAYLLTGLFLVAAAGAPFAALAASHAAYAAAVHTEASEAASRHEVRALLTQPAGPAVVGYTLSSEVPVQATWTSVAGVRRTGQVVVPAGSPKGTAVTVWTDAAGDLTSPPLLASQVAGQADTAAICAIAGVGVLYLCEAAIIRRVLTRRRMAAWDADWEVTAQAWNRQR
jgi:hypothetical protein